LATDSSVTLGMTNVNDPGAITCFACGEVNTPDSRFCKLCGRQLLQARERHSVANDPRNRFLLWLVLILLVACAVFGIFGVLSSKVFR
jgi:predicted nucleic acid-binding Zn ribbon protein